MKPFIKYIVVWFLVVTAVVCFVLFYQPLSSQPNFREEPAITSKYEQCMKINDCLLYTMTAYHEARSEPDMGVIAVMAVVKNRMQDTTGRFPKTVQGVLTQKCEFSYTCEKIMQKPVDVAAWNRVATLAYDFYNDKYILSKDLKFYHATYVKHKPRYTKYHPEVMTVGKHVFYSCSERYC